MQEGFLDGQDLQEGDPLVACSTVCCFSFKEKRFRKYPGFVVAHSPLLWEVECAVSALEDVQWSPELFDCLKIPSTTKTLLSSLAKACLPGLGTYGAVRRCG